MYAVDGSLHTNFLRNTQLVLVSMSDLAEKLQTSFQLTLNGPSGRLSRVSASLNLSYHQVTHPKVYRTAFN